MYKILLQSYPNLINTFKETDVRYNYIEYMDLLCDCNKYKEHKDKNSKKYIKVCNLLDYIKNNIDQYKRLRVLMFELEYLGIVPIETQQILTEEELNEGAKILQSIAKLNYWH